MRLLIALLQTILRGTHKISTEKFGYVTRNAYLCIVITNL